VPETSTLDPRFRPLADALVRALHGADARFRVTSARRSALDQQRLYNDWLRGASPFPALPPGRSQHELGLAVDVARWGIDPGKDELLAEFGLAWRKAGFIWAGPKDPVHFQAPRSMAPAR